MSRRSIRLKNQRTTNSNKHAYMHGQLIRKKYVCVEESKSVRDKKVSLQEFMQDVVETNQEELGRLKELCDILDQLRNEKTAIYVTSVTSDL